MHTFLQLAWRDYGFKKGWEISWQAIWIQMKISTNKTENKNCIKHREKYLNWVNNTDTIRHYKNGKHWYEHTMNNKIYLYIMMREIIETHNNRTRRILKIKEKYYWQKKNNYLFYFLLLARTHWLKTELGVDLISS